MATPELLATLTSPDLAPVLWGHPDPSDTPLARFMRHIQKKHAASTSPLWFENYAALYAWSVTDVAAFWAEVWDFCGVVASTPYTHVLPPAASESPTSHQMFPRPDFFAGAKLNFAENLLFPAGVAIQQDDDDDDDTATAVITVTERTADTDGTATSWAALREAVRACAAALRAFGLAPGDVVAGFVSNHLEALVAMLAAASIGAVWTAISPDNGVSAVLDRLVQIRPRVLVADNAMVYNGKVWGAAAKTAEIVRALAGVGLGLVVVVESVRGEAMGLEELRRQDGLGAGTRVVGWDEFLQTAGGEDLRFEQLPPSHPLYILFSSGTTGLPKAIVHTAGGTLLQHKKEHYLHCSLTAKSRMLYYTTTSWMMWHWSISALAVGASLVLYTGSPFQPHSHLSLPRLLARLRVTHFGTSAAYLVALEAAGVRPAAQLDLSALEAIYSTASPLPPSTFRYVYSDGAFPPHVNLASITGGTDIISLFGAPCPLLPVRVGEIQCAGLGMAVKVVDSASPADAPAEVPRGEPGELVCVRPFPSQPLTFFGEGGEEKYRAAYFDRFPGIWAHGDFVTLTASNGLLMLGRSDGVLKPAGVRFGSAEIYNLLTSHFAPTIADAVCVGRRRPAIDTDETVCLFVVMQPGAAAFVPGETDVAIKAVVRRELSARHVPAVVVECGPEGVPKTANGKKIEVAVKQILSGLPVKVNASVANPGALEWFRRWAEENP